MTTGFNTQPPEGGWRATRRQRDDGAGFNTQPPEGGWVAQGCAALHLRCFNTQPPEGGWLICDALVSNILRFQHTAARRRLGDELNKSQITGLFQHTAARRRLVMVCLSRMGGNAVSTHSRPKAAGASPVSNSSLRLFQHTAARRRLVLLHRFGKVRRRFNTQPPEGGWLPDFTPSITGSGFNTQPPEGGWYFRRLVALLGVVSTHSRPKAAGWRRGLRLWRNLAFQHTAARRRLGCCTAQTFRGCRFNTQPPEGGWPNSGRPTASIVSFNTQPPEGGWLSWRKIEQSC